MTSAAAALSRSARLALAARSAAGPARPPTSSRPPEARPPSCCQRREALEAAPSGIVSGLDLGRLISSRSGSFARSPPRPPPGPASSPTTPCPPAPTSNEEGEDRVGLEIIEKFPMR
ncbi:hypothetical protein ZWY2020_008340 [Hordeum vulgare]|nr:hypothetical protein ZWY2020_008340 [Hordeum vulgare]